MCGKSFQSLIKIVKESCYNGKRHEENITLCLLQIFHEDSINEYWYDTMYCIYKEKYTYLFFHRFPDTDPKNLGISFVIRAIKVSFGMGSGWVWKDSNEPRMGSDCTGKDCLQEGGHVHSYPSPGLLSTAPLLRSTSGRVMELSVERSPMANDLMHHD